MRGLLRAFPPCLASYRDGRKLTDAYRLLITKKPVDYDYVVVDVNSFLSGGQRLAKNITPESRRNKEVARHVMTALEQLLRRVVCKHALLLAFDGAGTAAKVHGFRHARVNRKLESRLLRLPGMPLTRAVEERLVRSMPLARGVLPREVVVSGTSVEGSVERKAAAWALDLAARDGGQQHTTRSLCVVGAGALVHTLLAATPYFQVTHVMHGSADLRHLTLSGMLAWLEMDAEAQTRDTRVLTSGRLDALLLLLLCSGCETTNLSALPGAHFREAMDAYHDHRRRRHDSASDEKKEGAPPVPSASPTEPPFQVLYEMPNGELVMDLLALYVIFTAREVAAAEMAKWTATGATSPFTRPPGAPVASTPNTTATDGTTAAAGGDGGGADVSTDASTTVIASQLSAVNALLRMDAQATVLESYLTHVLSSLYLLCYGETLAEAARLPAYFLLGHNVTTGEEEGVGSGGARTGHGLLALHHLLTFIKDSLRQGERYRRVGKAATSAGNPSSAAPTTPVYAPFWSADQLWTSAEYALLSQINASHTEALLREYLPGVPSSRIPDLARSVVAAQRPVDERRVLLQRWLATASADAAHPALCFSPSIYWARNDKSRMWSLRYIDLGVQARRADVRHRRSLLSEAHVLQQQAQEGAVVFDVVAQAWVGQATFPLPPPSTITAGGVAGRSPAAAVAGAQTLKLLTWNVMFDRYSGQPTPLGMPGIDWCSPQRYPVLAKLIAEEDADVVGMQEVEPAFAHYLAAQPWCQERYILSSSPHGSMLEPWGVLMLVRRGIDAWPVKQLLYLNVPAWSGHVSLMPTVTLDISGSRHAPPSSATLRSTPHSTSACTTAGQVSVCAMHLLAPYLKAHETARTGQDQALRHCLTRQVQGDCVVMGDFNDWPSNEFTMPAETRYVECWPLVRPGDYGKTMDESNTFCKMKIEEIFFGRSDKLFLRTGKPAAGVPPLLKPVEAHLVGTRSVNAENGNTEAPAYLFPSDHYGVSMTFHILPRA